MPKTTSMKCLCLVIISIWQQQLKSLFKATKKGFCPTTSGLKTCRKSLVTVQILKGIMLQQRMFSWHRRLIELLHQNGWIFFVTLQVKRDQWGYSNTGNNGWSDGLSQPHYNGMRTTYPLQQNWEGESCPISQPISPSSTPLDLTFPPVTWSSTCFNFHQETFSYCNRSCRRWQIVQLITVWQVLFKCRSLPRALSRQYQALRRHASWEVKEGRAVHQSEAAGSLGGPACSHQQIHDSDLRRWPRVKWWSLKWRHSYFKWIKQSRV